MASGFGEGFVQLLRHQEDRGVRAVLQTLEDLGFMYTDRSQEVIHFEVKNTVDLPGGGTRSIHMTSLVSVQAFNYILEKHLNNG